MTLDIKFGDMNKDPPKIKQNMLLKVILMVTLKSTFVFFINFIQRCVISKNFLFCEHYFCLVNTLRSVYTT